MCVVHAGIRLMAILLLQPPTQEPTRDAGRETSSPETALSKKQAKKEKERLIKELQLITEERNDLRDRLRFLTERSMKNRYESLQMLLFHSWVCKVTFILSY
ncbi:rCG39259 [Rattus norvegicus]|uniref:RCG39259 n=1 Tax=Rattus norvegicus TaxID=10116 RepID=A6KUX0_RAT|nr:rCG39259 [Rattus norvegicus]